MNQASDAAQRAEALHEAAQAKSEAGDEDAALALYLEALALDRARPGTLYNIGLIYKYRRDWEKSLRYNLMAAELRGDDPATNWNTAIAATALKDWKQARAAWKREGIGIEGEEGPIVGNFGVACVRLNGFEEDDGAVETVWVRRLSPVTARINNIPTPAARYRYGDVVLHDGAPTGSRLNSDGREVSVFNVFELFEASSFATYQVIIEAPDEAAVETLFEICDAAQVPFEDWTNMRILCKACSEGRAHEQHDHDEADTEWRSERRVGIGAQDDDVVTEVLERWVAGDAARRVLSVDGED